MFERHQASSSCVAMAARWCAARVRAFRRRRSRSSAASRATVSCSSRSRWSASCAWASRSSVAPRRRAAVAVVATIVAARRHARARRPGIPLLGQQDLWIVPAPGQPLRTRPARPGSCSDDGLGSEVSVRSRNHPRSQSAPAAWLVASTTVRSSFLGFLARSSTGGQPRATNPLTKKGHNSLSTRGKRRGSDWAASRRENGQKP